jgi:hypothetical protein
MKALLNERNCPCAVLCGQENENNIAEAAEKVCWDPANIWLGK